MRVYYLSTYLIILFLLVSLTVPIAKASTLYVDQSGTCIGAYTTVENALLNANDGDTIIFCSNINDISPNILVNKNITLIGNGYSWNVEDVDVSDPAISVVGGNTLNIENLNITIYDTLIYPIEFGLLVNQSSTLVLNNSYFTFLVEASSADGYGILISYDSSGYIQNSYVTSYTSYIPTESRTIASENSNLTILNSSITASHFGATLQIESTYSLSSTFYLISSTVNSPYAYGVRFLSKAYISMTDIYGRIEDSSIYSRAAAVTVASIRGGSSTLEILRTYMFSHLDGVLAGAGDPTSPFASATSLYMNDVDIDIMSLDLFTTGIGLYGTSGDILFNLNNVDIDIDVSTATTLYTVGVAINIGNRIIAGPRGSAIGSLNNVSISGSMYGVSMITSAPFLLGGGGAIEVNGSDININNVDTGVLIGYDPYTLNVMGISYPISDALLVDVSFRDIHFSNVNVGTYIGRVGGESAFYSIDMNGVTFENPAGNVGLIVNNTSPYSSMEVNIDSLMYSGSPPYTSTPGLISYGSSYFQLNISYSIIGSFILDADDYYDVFIYESVYDELNSIVSNILRPNSTWTLGVLVIDSFSSKPVNGMYVKVFNSTSMYSFSYTDNQGFAPLRLSYIYDPSNPQIIQLVITLGKNLMEWNYNYTLFEGRYTLPYWYENITIYVDLGVINAHIFGDLGNGFLSIEGRKGYILVGSLLSMWLNKYDLYIYGRYLVSDLLVIKATLLHEGVWLDGYIFILIDDGLVYMEFGGIEYRGYLV